MVTHLQLLCSRVIMVGRLHPLLLPISHSAFRHTSSAAFSLRDYDCVGFDLDHTLCRYAVAPLVQMIYNECLVPHISARLIGSATRDTLQTFVAAEHLHLCARGLVLNSATGDLLKLGADGRVLKAVHGWRHLYEQRLLPDKLHTCLRAYMTDPGDSSLRMFRDYFDVPAILAVMRLVDGVDRGVVGADYGYVWRVIEEAIVHMYRRAQWRQRGEFFTRLRSNTELYAHRCGSVVSDTLVNLRMRGIFTFLITSSNIDYANHMLRHCLGADWMSLFDVVVVYARKPYFFSSQCAPFLRVASDLSCEVQEEITSLPQISTAHSVYSQGNWMQLLAAMSRQRGTSVTSCRCLYVGDNVQYDAFPVVNYTQADCALICPEMRQAEPYVGDCWGNIYMEPTIWSPTIQRCVNVSPSLETLFTTHF